jgi:hypothetical protein
VDDEHQDQLSVLMLVNDTPGEIAAQFDALMAERSGSDRVRMACEMFDLARASAVASIKAEEPSIGVD